MAASGDQTAQVITLRSEPSTQKHAPSQQGYFINRIQNVLKILYLKDELELHFF